MGLSNNETYFEFSQAEQILQRLIDDGEMTKDEILNALEGESGLTDKDE